MTRLVGTILLLIAGALWAAGPPDRETWERFGEIEGARRLEARGLGLWSQGKRLEAARTFMDLAKARAGLYPEGRFPAGHPELARSIDLLGFLARDTGDLPLAEEFYARALKMREALYPREQYPLGHADLATSLNALAGVYQDAGDFAGAEPLFARALAMRERLYPRAAYPRGHPDLARSLNNLALVYQLRGELANAESLYARALGMRNALYPKEEYPAGHSDLAFALGNMAGLYTAQGEYAKAEPLYARALAMREAVYPPEKFPRGHPLIARSMNDLAGAFTDRGGHAKAISLHRRALAMQMKLYPARGRFAQGHPDIARSLNNLAYLYDIQGESDEAESAYRRALAMRAAMHPRGHPELAQSLNNLASLLSDEQRYAEAESLHGRALAMQEALYPAEHYPQGHPELARSLNNVGGLYHAWGKYSKAETMLRQSLAMNVAGASGLAASAAEAQALNYLASLPQTRDAYLSVTLHLSATDAYPAVWQSKAALARVYEWRHLAVLASSGEARALWDAVLSLKRERERLLLAPANASGAAARDARLDEIDGRIRKKAADLGRLLPAMRRSADLAKSTPSALRKALPKQAAFVDLLRYTRFENDPKKPGRKGRKRTPHYVAFVVTREAVARVELGGAVPIEEALALWRRAIDENSDSHARYAGTVRDLVWAPVAKHLASARTVYLCPDMDLSRLPWAALPGKSPATILLEDHLLVTVPHGPYLLDRLTAERREAPAKPTVLAMGGVGYDDKPATALLASLRSPVEGKKLWGELKGTGDEIASLTRLPGERTFITLTADKADIAALLAALPRAEAAHLATHGYFADKKFRSVLQLDEKLFGRTGNERSGAGARNPMVLSGLVCAGANVEGTPNRGIVTADAIVGLDLRKLNLAVLSACETGLGDVAGGEGVFGLTRAFHVAGARNVVASLWKVEDEPTAALMKIFYNNLWVEKLAPAEALRQAQLAVYRDPGSVKGWAARAPLPRPVAGGTTKPREKGAKVASPRVYAAFVLSGPGD